MYNHTFLIVFSFHGGENMYPKKLPKQEHYFYSNEEVFTDPADMIHGFENTNYSSGMHVQQFIEINIITSGSGMHYVARQRIPVKRGDMFIIPPNMSHGYTAGADFNVYHLLISNRFMEKYQSDLQTLPSFYVLFRAEPLMRTSGAGLLHLSLDDDQLQMIAPLLEAVRAQLPPRSPGEAILRNSAAIMLITHLCEIYARNTDTAPPSAEPHDEAFMHALALIHEHYDEKLDIDRLAKAAHLSRSTFLRRFGEVCKTTPSRYLMQRRLEAVRHLLIYTALSTGDIATRTGFYDGAHLIRCFTKEMGCSPTAYRRSHATRAGY